MASEPEALITWFRELGVEMSRIGLEAGPLSQWLYAGMREAGLTVELLETRHVRAAFKAMPVKTDRNDARGIAQLMRLGWFRSVHCKSLPAQELRAVLTARKLVQGKRHDMEMSLRGILRGFGLNVGQTTPRSFEGRVRELVTGHETLRAVADALLLARATLGEQLGLDEDVVGVELALDGVAVFEQLAMEMLITTAAARRLHVGHPEVVGKRADQPHCLLEGVFDLEA